MTYKIDKFYKLTFLIIAVSFQAFSQQSFENKKQNPNKNGSELWKEEFKTIVGNKNSNESNPKSTFRIKNDSLDIKYDEFNTAIIYFKNYDNSSNNNKNAKVSFAQLAESFLKTNEAILRLKDVDNEFILENQETDELGISHLKFQQIYKNIPIFGAEVLIHGKEKIDFLNGRLYPSPTLEIDQIINENEAIEVAFQDLNKITEVNRSQKISLLKSSKDEANLVIYYEGTKPKLAYYTVVKANILERWVYMIDAKNGEIIYKFNHSCTFDGTINTSAKDLKGITRTFNAIQNAGTFYLIDTEKSMYNKSGSKLPNEPVGVIWTIDANNSKAGSSNLQLSHVVSTNGKTWSPTAVSAHVNASICYDYFKNKHQRNSLNNNGGNIVSVINLIDDDGNGLDNAFWNGEFMGYGNGYKAFSPLAGALDVAAHELTHGVVENTARLEYRSQSGALNESFADIFGVLVDSDNWTLGEDIVNKNIFPTGALRSLENPNQAGKNVEGYQPKTMSQYLQLKETEEQDNGGVHVNSGIPNYAFYLFANNPNVGRENAGKVYYRALNTYLTRTSKFIDARIAVLQSAKDLFGDGSQVMIAAANAFDQVGITGTTTTNPGNNENTNLPENPGEERMVVYDPTDKSLYKVGFQNQNDITKISSSLGCLGKPSVTDNGQYVYFVGEDKNIYRINLSTNNSAEKLSQNGTFRNVAISKNGRLLAALASSVDNYIYVFDLKNNKNVKFQLYNPTYSQGVSTGDVLYADSFEWDYSGENLIYDAYNEVKSLFGKYEYWDVGILNAWSNSSGSFAEGKIDKLFTSLDKGENIGNPALAKTTKNIIAFDYYNESDDKNYIVTANFETGDIKTVIENNAIAYPDYAKADNFLSFNTIRNSNVESVDLVKMSADKTTASSSPQPLFKEAKWGVWYALGERQIPQLKEQTISFEPISDILPGQAIVLKASASSNLSVQYILKSGDATIKDNLLTAGEKPGKVTVSAFQAGNSSFKEASVEQSVCIIPKAPIISELANSLTASGGSNYQWYVNGNAIGGVSSNSTINKDFAGTYTAKSVTADGCFSSFSNGIKIIPLATQENIAANKLRVFPNPSKGNIEVNIGEVGVKSFLIYTINGKQIMNISGNKANLPQIESGEYIILVNDQEKTYSKRIIFE